MSSAWPIGTIAVVGSVVALIGVIGGHIAEKRDKAKQKVAEAGKAQQKQSAAMANTEELMASCR